MFAEIDGILNYSIKWSSLKSFLFIMVMDLHCKSQHSESGILANPVKYNIPALHVTEAWHMVELKAFFSQ